MASHRQLGAASAERHQLHDRTTSARPIGNVLPGDVDGTCYLLAAGAANTAGKGGPYKMSRGTVPVDKGNTTTWAIEAANNGVGQVWPQVQIDAFFKISNELNFQFGNQPTDLFTHQATRPGRKIDPADRGVVLGPWKPRSLNACRVVVGRRRQGRGATPLAASPSADTAEPSPTPEPTRSRQPPVSTSKGRSQMYAAIMKYGRTATDGWGGWFSPTAADAYQVRVRASRRPDRRARSGRRVVTRGGHRSRVGRRRPYSRPKATSTPTSGSPADGAARQRRHLHGHRGVRQRRRLDPGRHRRVHPGPVPARRRHGGPADDDRSPPRSSPPSTSSARSPSSCRPPTTPT